MKRAEVDPLHVIVGVTLLLIVAIVLLAVFRVQFGKSVETTSSTLDAIISKSDVDGDGIYDIFDRCPCTNKLTEQYSSIAADGCGINEDAEGSKEKPPIGNDEVRCKQLIKNENAKK